MVLALFSNCKGTSYIATDRMIKEFERYKESRVEQIKEERRLELEAKQTDRGKKGFRSRLNK